MPPKGRRPVAREDMEIETAHEEENRTMKKDIADLKNLTEEQKRALEDLRQRSAQQILASREDRRVDAFIKILQAVTRTFGLAVVAWLGYRLVDEVVAGWQQDREHRAKLQGYEREVRELELKKVQQLPVTQFHEWQEHTRLLRPEKEQSFLMRLLFNHSYELLVAGTTLVAGAVAKTFQNRLWEKMKGTVRNMVSPRQEPQQQRTQAEQQRTQADQQRQRDIDDGHQAAAIFR